MDTEVVICSNSRTSLKDIEGLIRSNARASLKEAEGLICSNSRASLKDPEGFNISCASLKEMDKSQDAPPTAKQQPGSGGSQQGYPDDSSTSLGWSLSLLSQPPDASQPPNASQPPTALQPSNGEPIRGFSHSYTEGMMRSNPHPNLSRSCRTLGVLYTGGG